MFDNENIFPIERESDKNESISNSENLTDSIDIYKIQTKVLPFKTMIVIIITKNIQKLKDFVEYKILGSNDFQNAQIIKRAGKVSGKYSNWYNIIKNLYDDGFTSIDWERVDKWKQYS